MKHPVFITFTGLTNQTDARRVVELSANYRIEWGLLYSNDRSQDHKKVENRRYMGSFDMLQTISVLRNHGCAIALHLCGESARSAMNTGGFELPSLGIGRIQVNVREEFMETDKKLEQATKLSENTEAIVILQTRDVRSFRKTVGHPKTEDRRGSRVMWLYDRSGGRGIVGQRWPRNETDDMVGFAGGLRPSNVKSINDVLVSEGPYWLDMESGVMNSDGTMDLDKVEAVCRAVYGEPQTSA